MSYCRFSSDQFQCDVYVYESSDGWVIHVASSRSKLKSPKIPWRATGKWYSSISFKWYGWRYTLWSKYRRLKPIGLPYDGETTTHETPDECAEHLEHLKCCGYNVPLDVIETLHEEQIELEKSK